MKKKATRKLKQNKLKHKIKKSLKSSSKAGRVARTAPPVIPKPKPNPRYTQAVQNFETGMKHMQAQRFERAAAAFEKVFEGPDLGLADRARVYLNACRQYLSKKSTSFKTPEEHYDYAVALMNGGDFEGARSHLERLLRQHPKADYGHYGLALLHCLTGRVEESLRALDAAIRLNVNNRFQARNDSDFANMADDPRFTELIYPEPEAASEAPPPPPPARIRKATRKRGRK